MFVLILNHARYPANPRLIPRTRAQASHGNITVLSLLKTVSTETVHMAKSQPRKNRSEHSDLPQDYLAI